MGLMKHSSSFFLYILRKADFSIYVFFLKFLRSIALSIAFHCQNNSSMFPNTIWVFGHCVDVLYFSIVLSLSKAIHWDPWSHPLCMSLIFFIFYRLFSSFPTWMQHAISATFIIWQRSKWRRWPLIGSHYMPWPLIGC